MRALHRLVTGQALDEVQAWLGRELTDPERRGLSTGEHAGTWETSWYLAMHPEWVDPRWSERAEDHPPRWAPLVRVAGWLRALGLGARRGGGLGLPAALEGLAGGVGWLRNATSG